jgi:mono/diheme cytochrome c family protein
MRSILAASLLACALAACGDNDEVRPDSGGGAIPDAEPGVQPSVARGRYLVDHVGLCGDCHTPRLGTGAPDPDNYLAGVECFIDVDDNPNVGCLHTRNLTHHATGLMTRSDAEIKAMIVDGVRPNGDALVPLMPYWVFHNFTANDVDSIVMYLRTVTGVDHTVPPNQVPFTPPAEPAPPLPQAAIPQPTVVNASTTRGRYLAGIACIDCHTALTDMNDFRSIDLTRVFAGGRGFPRDLFGLPPQLPEVIFTMNLTPHATGLADYTAADIARVLLSGVDAAGDGVCPPMPSGPMGPFAGLTEDDAADIAAYIDALAPIDNAIPNGCAIPK